MGGRSGELKEGEVVRASRAFAPCLVVVVSLSLV
jgi:hypothetical protein